MSNGWWVSVATILVYMIFWRYFPIATWLIACASLFALCLYAWYRGRKVRLKREAES